MLLFGKIVRKERSIEGHREMRSIVFAYRSSMQRLIPPVMILKAAVLDFQVARKIYCLPMEYQCPKGTYDLLPYGAEEAWQQSDLWQFVEEAARKVASESRHSDLRRV